MKQQQEVGMRHIDRRAVKGHQAQVATYEEFLQLTNQASERDADLSTGESALILAALCTLAVSILSFSLFT